MIKALPLRNPHQAAPALAGPHLTDEQFSDLLAGDSPDRRTLAHLEACAACRSEAANARLGVQSFRELSLNWAEREAPRRVQVPSRLSLCWGGHWVRSAGMGAAAAAVVLAMGLHMPRTAAAPANGTAAASVTPTGHEIEEDNRLLASIDSELTLAAQPAVPVRELRSAEPSPRPEGTPETAAN